MTKDQLIVVLVTALITLLGHVVIAIVNHKLAIVRDKRRERLEAREDHPRDIVPMLDNKYEHGK